MTDAFIGTDLFSDLDRLQRQMAALFGGLPSSIRAGRFGAFPSINIGATYDSIEIVAFAPGVKQENLEVSIDRGLLTISGERHSVLPDIAVEHNMSAAARVLEVVADRANEYSISVGTTFPKDKDAGPHLEVALATMFGIKPDQITMDVTVVSQAEVDLHFGVYERMLAERIGIVPRIQ